MSSIEFFEKEGRIYFECHERVYDSRGSYAGRAFRAYDAQGRVPQDIVTQGKEAIMRWTRTYVDKVIKVQKEKDRKFDELRRAINVPIDAIHKGIVLQGRIVSLDGALTIVLDSPICGQSSFRYGHGFGAAMAGHKVWAASDKELVFTREALNYARAALVRIFKNHLNASVIALVDELNSP